MANTYKWIINALDAKISHDSKDNVIKQFTGDIPQ